MKPIDVLKNTTAKVASHPMYPASTTNKAGMPSAKAVFIFLIQTTRMSPFCNIKSERAPTKRVITSWHMYGAEDSIPLCV